MNLDKRNRRFFVVLFTMFGLACFLLVFIPPLFKEGGLIGAGILFAFSILSWAFAFMVNKG